MSDTRPAFGWVDNESFREIFGGGEWILISQSSCPGGVFRGPWCTASNFSTATQEMAPAGSSIVAGSSWRRESYLIISERANTLYIFLYPSEKTWRTAGLRFEVSKDGTTTYNPDLHAKWWQLYRRYILDLGDVAKRYPKLGNLPLSPR